MRRMLFPLLMKSPSSSLKASSSLGVYKMHAGGCDITVFPLLADPNGLASGAGTIQIEPKKRHAYHNNEYGAAYYHQELRYSPLSHLVKVYCCCVCFFH
jgi:hypothetical protein